ncbi:hypothetical protein [Mesorhizobium sp. B2-4-17]|uniref:hypothetical protein n=1 Tax=Mesorhizobium sp. B2-4-17 TaxID=2589932 RepID=UPI00112CB578|nr:hypothetical protein [Mesorhizobium sp. B2-4-17]TPK91792.1 hypothetical protein FJ548_01840 [Mesorhizobium sp. B2-4-17]
MLKQNFERWRQHDDLHKAPSQDHADTDNPAIQICDDDTAFAISRYNPDVGAKSGKADRALRYDLRSAGRK